MNRDTKIVVKPWGREIWLELNDKYCYKRIEIHAGFKTSYQLHNFKLETNYIISGQAEVWLEDDKGVVNTYIMNAGDYFTVVPKRKHRVIAITDVILQEVSTPEVDDVVRLNDEFNRGDGKIQEEHERPVVCILAAGMGTRLEQLGKSCHKTLLPLKHKAILSHCIDHFSKETEFVIAVGHLKDQIAEYVKVYHPDRAIHLIEVDNYSGVGSGPAYSVACCRKMLQRPFYLCVSDLYTETPLQNKTFRTTNWIGLCKTTTPEMYSTVKVVDGRAEELVNKSPTGYDHAFTGAFYMYDFKLFWEQFDLCVGPSTELVDVFKTIGMFKFDIKDIDWHDVGTYALYDKLVDKTLYLHNIKHEHKYRVGNLFIKKLESSSKIQKLEQRAKALGDRTPQLVHAGQHFIAYPYVEGRTLYEENDGKAYADFLLWYESNVIKSVVPVDISASAAVFYKTKTLDRVAMLRANPKFSVLDSVQSINGVPVKPLQFYLESIPWESLSRTLTTPLFHGDLQFDNIVHTSTGFMLIDLREDFGGNVEYGDLYYDLAKLHGGMCLNYLRMKERSSYSISEDGSRVSNFVDPILKSLSENEFKAMLDRNGLELKRFNILSSLFFIIIGPININ
jgi:choline kinase/quercetin dioxygenase-like cupin family protein